MLNNQFKWDVAVIGLGYVGLPLAKEFLSTGYKVLGVDIDPEKESLLKAGISYIKHIDNAFFKEKSEEGLFDATSDFDRLSEAYAIVICVPTPIDIHYTPDLSYVIGTAKEISKRLKRGQLIVLESTTYPGTTEEILLPILESSGLKVGTDFYLGYSPEREDPGNKEYTTRTIPKIISGMTDECLKRVKNLYSRIIEKLVPVSSPKVAEATKILENTYRAVNIALVNELKIVFEQMGIDIWEVIEAAKTKPFGFQAFYPGPGIGGHCIPVDPFYLTWKAKEYDIHTRFIELAGEINNHMPNYVVSKASKVLNTVRKPLNGSKVLIIGVAYKPDVDDLRESPALKVIDMLEKEKAEVLYHDPYVPEIPETRKYKIKKKSVPLTKELLESADLVIITTNHSNIDYEFIRKHSKLILDTRNVYKTKGLSEGNVWKA